MRKNLFFLRSLVLLFFLVISFAVPADAAQPGQDEGGYQMYTAIFLPRLFNRMCVGDSRTLQFTVRYNEPPADQEPAASEGEAEPPVPAPLNIRFARVSTTNGSVSQSEFPIVSHFHAFSFQYTAKSPGTETVTVQVEDGNTITKSFPVFDSCDFKLSFFVHQRQETDQGGFDVFFHGKGEFGITHTEQEAAVLKGNGTDRVTFGLWAQNSAAADLISCEMVPMRSGGGFDIDGSLTSPLLAFMQLTLSFDDVKFPGEMIFSCSAYKMGTFVFQETIGETSGDPDEIGLAGILLPPFGGTYNFSKSGYTGILTVTPKR